MDVNVHCEHCGHDFTVPHDRTGRQGQCPTCENTVYIPTPPEELDEIPLADEDNAEREHEQRLRKERQEIDRLLAKGEGVPDAAAPSPAPAGGRQKKLTVRDAVVAYLSSMSDSDLERADKYLAQLRTRPREARAVVDGLIADQIPPQELAEVPPGVYQGFLRNLSSQLG